MVVLESLSVGTPVITTWDAPWHQLQGLGCGWLSESTVESLSSTLSEALLTSPQQLSSMSKISIDYVKNHYSPSSCGHDLSSGYHWLLNGGSKPSNVLV